MTNAQTHDLGHGWFININSENGVETAIVRNPDKGQRIDLPALSMEILRQILNKNYRVS